MRSKLRAVLEKATGESVQQLREMSISDRRNMLDARGQQMTIVSRKPVIGRGSVLTDRLVSHEVVEAQLAEALRK